MSTDPHHARRLYDDAIVIDALNVSNWDSDAVFESLNAGGVAAINATQATWEGYEETLDMIAKWYVRFREREDQILLVETVDDIHRAKREGKTGIIFGWQNTSPIENDLDRLELFHKLGVRIMQVTYHERNLLGDGCMERQDGGLTNFGIDAVQEMNRLGILLDLSHVGISTTQESIEVSEKPVAITHANAKTYFDHRRNKTDKAIKTMAEKGGVIGATCIQGFLRNTYDSTIGDYLDAIDHLVDMVGSITLVSVLTTRKTNPKSSGNTSAANRARNTLPVSRPQRHALGLGRSIPSRSENSRPIASIVRIAAEPRLLGRGCCKDTRWQLAAIV